MSSDAGPGGGTPDSASRRDGPGRITSCCRITKIPGGVNSGCRAGSGSSRQRHTAARITRRGVSKGATLSPLRCHRIAALPLLLWLLPPSSCYLLSAPRRPPRIATAG
ncbi:unnamed protein product, partial [Phaeothamnion confervicola]